MKANIGNVLISQLKSQGKQYDVYDNKLKGFLVRVTSTGKMNYVCQYRRGGRVNIGKVGVLTPVQAREKAIEIISNYNKGIDPGIEKKKIKPHTFNEFFNNEYAPWFRANRKSAKSLNNLKPFFKLFGCKYMKEVSPFLVEKWRTKRLEDGIKPSTVNRNLVSLKSIFARALEWGAIDANPLSKLKLSKIDKISVVRYLSRDEEIRLRQALDVREERIRQDRDNGNLWRRERDYGEMPTLRDLYFADHLKPMVLLSINTGLRKGELFSLKWENISFERSIITVKGDDSKSGSTRHIPLNNEAFQVLKEWRAQNEDIDNTLVFSSVDGKQFDDVKKSWARLKELSQIKDFRWHDMRHHFASWLVMNSVDLNTVRELLGHAEIKTTLRYAHLAPEHKANAVAKLNNPDMFNLPRINSTDAMLIEPRI